MIPLEPENENATYATCKPRPAPTKAKWVMLFYIFKALYKKWNLREDYY